MVHKGPDPEGAATLQLAIQRLEREGRVSRTFRRLDPERQQAVIDAIVEEAAEAGPSKINVKRVAKRAGVSVGSLYQYFGDRERLVAFAVEACVQAMGALFEESRSYLAAMPLREALSAYLTYGVEWSKSRSGFVRLFGRAAYAGEAAMARPLVRPVASMMAAVVRDLLAAAAARGEIRADVDREAACRAVNVLLIGIGDAALMPHINGYLRVTDDSMPVDRVVSAAVDLVLRGIGAP